MCEVFGFFVVVVFYMALSRKTRLFIVSPSCSVLCQELLLGLPILICFEFPWHSFLLGRRGHCQRCSGAVDTQVNKMELFNLSASPQTWTTKITHVSFLKLYEQNREGCFDTLISCHAFFFSKLTFLWSLD